MDCKHRLWIQGHYLIDQLGRDLKRFPGRGTEIHQTVKYFSARFHFSYELKQSQDGSCALRPGLIDVILARGCPDIIQIPSENEEVAIEVSIEL